jgi:hypothetical protein
MIEYVNSTTCCPGEAIHHYSNFADTCFSITVYFIAKDFRFSELWNLGDLITVTVHLIC